MLCNTTVLTVPQTAARLKCNPETVRRWIRSGRLRSRKVGSQHLIEERDLADLVGDATLPIPKGWKRTATGEPMPDVVAAIHRSRAKH